MIRIKIVKLGESELIIEPVGHSYDPLNQLIREWGVEPYMLTKDIHFTIKELTFLYSDRKLKQIVFSKPPNILKALAVIPTEQIEFSADISERSYHNFRYKFASAVSKHHCWVSEEKFLKQIDLEIFNYIKGEILKDHSHYREQSNIMTRLAAELEYITTLGKQSTFNVFENPMHVLAYTCLLFAEQEEKREKKTRASSFSFSSVLVPQYTKILQGTAQLSKFPSLLSEKQCLSIYNSTVRDRKPPFLPVSGAQAMPAQQTPQDALQFKTNETFTHSFFDQLVAQLSARQHMIQQRIDRNQWFQDRSKNAAKIGAIQEIIKAKREGKNTLELLSVIRAREGILRESTSTLPSFFRAKVTTAEILNESERFTRCLPNP